MKNKTLKKYTVQWLESKMILRDVYTSVQATSQEEAIKLVKERKDTLAKDFTKSRYKAKYQGKV